VTFTFTFTSLHIITLFIQFFRHVRKIAVSDC